VPKAENGGELATEARERADAGRLAAVASRLGARSTADIEQALDRLFQDKNRAEKQAADLAAAQVKAGEAQQEFARLEQAKQTADKKVTELLAELDQARRSLEQSDRLVRDKAAAEQKAADLTAELDRTRSRLGEFNRLARAREAAEKRVAELTADLATARTTAADADRRAGQAAARVKTLEDSLRAASQRPQPIPAEASTATDSATAVPDSQPPAAPVSGEPSMLPMPITEWNADPTWQPARRQSVIGRIFRGRR
jgi:chromosome segregation ATPase